MRKNKRGPWGLSRVGCWLALVLIVVGACTASAEVAVNEQAGENVEQSGGQGGMLSAIGAALAIGIAALATGMAQARIGAAGVGAIAENPKRLGMVIMLLAIPETVAILGFVIAYLIITQ